MNEAGVGSFLQGLMNGYKTAKEMSMQQEQLDLKKQEIEASKKIADAKLQEEKNKLEMQAQEKQNKVMSDATKQLEEDSIKDVNYAVGKYNKTMVDNKLPSRKAILTGQDNKQYVSDFTSDTIDGYYKIQASLANNDGMYIMKNGYLHSRNPDTGDYTRTNTFGESVDSLREAYRIKQAGTGTETLADGTIVTKAEALGKKAQDKTPKTSVTVMGTEQPIQVANEFGTYYADPKTGNPVTKGGTPLYKEMNAETKKTIESIDQSRKTVDSLNNMLSIVDKNPKAIGSFGQDPINYIANYANDYLGIPTDTLTSRTQIQGTSGILAAMTRKLYENGVMTDKDVARYEKIMPQANDNEEVFKNKAKVLIKELNAKVKQTEDRYKEVIPLRKVTTSNTEVEAEQNPLLQDNKPKEIKSSLTGSTVDTLWKKIEEKRKAEGR